MRASKDLIDLWILDDKVHILRFKNTTLDNLERYSDAVDMIPGISRVKDVWKRVTAKSSLRMMLRDWYASNAKLCKCLPHL
jgi:hypothetical protein